MGIVSNVAAYFSASTKRAAILKLVILADNDDLRKGKKYLKNCTRYVGCIDYIWTIVNVYLCSASSWQKVVFSLHFKLQ